MSENQHLNTLDDLEIATNPHWIELLSKPGGAAVLAGELPATFPAARVAEGGTSERRIWELIGAHYRERTLWHDAIVIYSAMYRHFLQLQVETRQRVPKGMPLVWIADCYANLANVTLSKRYLMLTLIEDAIGTSGKPDPVKIGSYFRLAWRHGLPDIEIKRYASEAYSYAEQSPEDAFFPEHILQNLDKNWLIEKPSPNDSSIYDANTVYVQHLLEKLGDKSGKMLERLADYLLSCIPGCRTARRQRSPSTEYDIVCSLEGPDVDFRSEFGRYFVCECKDWDKPVDFTAFAKFARVLSSVKAKFGIIFSREGITGQGEGTNADREQLKVFQSEGTIIVVVDYSDLRFVAKGGSFITLLRQKYEQVRLDLRSLQSTDGS